jgi:TPR repeat protein
MSNSKPTRRQPDSPELIFLRADKKWKSGALRSAFRLFLVAARRGDRASQLNVGYFYDQGIGVRRNRDAALRWYKRAYRRGDASAAINIGTIWRDENDLRRALSWFERARKLGDGSSNLEIAKVYLRKGDPVRAVDYLNSVCRSDRVTEGEMEQAKRLLKRIKKG